MSLCLVRRARLGMLEGESGTTKKKKQLSVFISHSTLHDTAAARLRSDMGSDDDAWLWCNRCWRWGKCLADEYLHGAQSLTDIDGLGLLCETCMALSEPPWWPNSRQRCALWLDKMRSLPTEIPIDSIVVFLSSNEP